ISPSIYSLCLPALPILSPASLLAIQLFTRPSEKDIISTNYVAIRGQIEKKKGLRGKGREGNPIEERLSLVSKIQCGKETAVLRHNGPLSQDQTEDQNKQKPPKQKKKIIQENVMSMAKCMEKESLGDTGEAERLQQCQGKYLITLTYIIIIKYELLLTIIILHMFEKLYEDVEDNEKHNHIFRGKNTQDEINSKRKDEYLETWRPRNLETSEPGDLETSGPGDLGTWRPRNLETWRPRDLETSGPGDLDLTWDLRPETWRPRDLETSGPRDLGTWRPRDLETSGPGDLGTWRPGDLGTWRPGDLATETSE
ncbi:hypothetical protein STEG23_018329, partial [Scotinomys teguina]